MAAKFEIKKNDKGQFHFNLKAGNGEVILSSSEMYTTKQSAEAGIASVTKNVTDDQRFERKSSSNGQHYFVLKAGNGEVIGKSEMYKATTGMENGIMSVKTNAPGAAVVELTS